ncbi:MAG: hypothetical protein ACYCO3_00655 [Mycobacteriales bacterium]
MTSTAAACTCTFPEGSSAPRCAWCPLTASSAGPQTPSGPVIRIGAPLVPEAPALFRYSRWAKGPTTFGPLGRVVATLLLLLPLPILVMSVAIGIGVIGVGMYCLIVMPWALRHIWAKAKIVIS